MALRTGRPRATATPAATVAAGAAEVRWAPRVSASAIRRLYETDALGLVDAEQIATLLAEAGARQPRPQWPPP